MWNISIMFYFVQLCNAGTNSGIGTPINDLFAVVDHRHVNVVDCTYAPPDLLNFCLLLLAIKLPQQNKFWIFHICMLITTF